MRLWPRAARPLPRGKVYCSQHSIHSVWTLVCTAQGRQRPRPISKVSSPKKKKKASTVYLGEIQSFGFWENSKQVLRQEVELKNGVKPVCQGHGRCLQLKVAALTFGLHFDEHHLRQRAPIRANGRINDCFVLPLRGRARSGDLFLICSPREAMRDLCA